MIRKLLGLVGLDPSVAIIGLSITLGATLVVGGAYWKGRSDCAAINRAEVAMETVKRLQQRGEIDNEIANLSELDLCRRLNGLCELGQSEPSGVGVCTDNP